MNNTLLDDIVIFLSVVQEKGFSHAAKRLGLSNGLISRRIANLEKQLNVLLIKRTTRQIELTAEGELLFEHAIRIQQELNSAMSLIQSSSKKPKGKIRLSCPVYFGRHYVMPIILKFMTHFPDIEIEIVLNNAQLDPIKEKFDLSIRGAGYVNSSALKNSGLRMRKLVTEKIGLYASQTYLNQQQPVNSIADLANHQIISFSSDHLKNNVDIWYYFENKIRKNVHIHSYFSSNDIETNLFACIQGKGIAKFTTLNVVAAVKQNLLIEVLPSVDWGQYEVFALFSGQNPLPKRTRLFLDFLITQVENL